MATASRVTTLLTIAVFTTYYLESDACVSIRLPDTSQLLKIESRKAFEKWIELGTEIFGKAFDSICWYVQLKAFPFNGHKGYFSGCHIPHESTAKQLFKRKINSTGSHLIPEYHSKCQDLLITPKAIPNENESSILLNDGEEDQAIKAYFHCLIQQVREIHGDDQISDNNERTHSKRNWMQTIHDRLNEFRSRHGVEPLQLNKTLTNDAQKWANRMAESCMHEMEEKYVSRNFAHIAWKGAKSVGYGYAFNPQCKNKGEGFIVAHFHPVGLKAGKYNTNVLPPVEMVPSPAKDEY